MTKFAFTALIGLLSLTFPALATERASYRAEYEINVVSASDPSAPPLSGWGTITREETDACAYWQTTETTNLNFEGATGMASSYESKVETREAKAGGRFFATQHEKMNDIPRSSRRVYAYRDADSQEVIVSYFKPDLPPLTLPHETLFPDELIRHIQAAAEQGEKFGNYLLFDGSQAFGEIKVSSFVGPVIQGAALQTLLKEKYGRKTDLPDDPLLDMPARILRLAFFPQHEETEKAENEIEMIVHENSVVSAMKFEKDGQTMVGMLRKIQQRNSQSCF